MKKILLIISFALLLLVGCGKTKIKTYTMAEKEAYLEKANNGDKEAEKLIRDAYEEATKIYKETGSKVAEREEAEWILIMTSLSTKEYPIIPSSW